MLAQILILASSTIVFLLGSLHLYFTFFSHKFSPRDRELEARLRTVSPVISTQTTYWRAAVGFHASHSIGALFFGTLYGYLAVAQPSFLFQTHFIALLGLLLLLSKLTLARLYWFDVPLRGIGLATVLYVAGFATALA
jgi:hypothetical protein